MVITQIPHTNPLSRDFNPSDHDVENDEWGEVWAFGKCCEIAQEALK